MTVEIIQAIGEFVVIPIGIFGCLAYLLYIISKD